jgi:hypothetical protein
MLMDHGWWRLNTNTWIKGPRGWRMDQGWIAHNTTKSKSTWRWWWRQHRQQLSRLGFDKNQGKISWALGGPLGQGHEGHTSTLEGCIQLHGLGGFGVLGLKNTGRVVFGFGPQNPGKDSRSHMGSWERLRWGEVTSWRAHDPPMLRRPPFYPPVVKWFVSKCVGILGMCNWSIVLLFSHSWSHKLPNYASSSNDSSSLSRCV